MTTWKNRIIGHGEKPASEFVANPANWRTHPMAQREAVKGSLNELGWIAEVIENVRTGNLIDGHERVWNALQLGDNTPVPFIQVDLSEEEEALALAILDPISAMAGADKDKLDELMQQIQTGEEGLQAMLSELAKSEGVAIDGLGLDGLPDIGTEDDGEELTTCPKCGFSYAIK